MSNDRATKVRRDDLSARRHELGQSVNALVLITDALRRRLAGTPETDALLSMLARATEELRALLLRPDSVRPVRHGPAGSGPAIELRSFPVGPALQRAAGSGSGSRLHIVPSTLFAIGDPWLAEALMGSLVSAALSLRPNGKVLVGCRRRGGTVRFCVCLGRGGNDTAQPAEAARPPTGEEPSGDAVLPGFDQQLRLAGKLAALLGVALAIDPGSGGFTVTLPRAPAAGPL